MSDLTLLAKVGFTNVTTRTQNRCSGQSVVGLLYSKLGLSQDSWLCFVDISILLASLLSYSTNQLNLDVDLCN